MAGHLFSGLEIKFPDYIRLTPTTLVVVKQKIVQTKHGIGSAEFLMCC